MTRFVDGVQDAESQVVEYDHDKDGRIKTLTNRLAKPFSWTYDDANRIVTTKTPLSRTTTAIFNTRGLPDTVTPPSNIPTTFDLYNLEGQLTQSTDGLGTTAYTYWPNGLLKDVTEGTHTTHREYDSANRLKRYDDREGNSVSYGYYDSGELKSIAYPGNKSVTYDYDDFGRLFHVTDWATRKTTYNYDAASRLTQISHSNGTYRVQTYFADNSLKSIADYKSDGSIFLYQNFKYDDDGRVFSFFRWPDLPAFSLSRDVLTYDDDNQLSTFNTQTVTFDVNGNMTNGPLPSSSFGSYAYDARDRLISAGGTGYRYNPDGLRVEITGSGASTFVLDPNAALSRALIRTQGGVTTYYVYGLGLLYEETAGATKTYHGDQVGSTLALTSDSQAVTDTWTYSPYGVPVARSGTADTPFQFNGEAGEVQQGSGR